MASVSSPPHALQVDLTRMGLRDKLGLYLRTVSTSGRRFFFEQVVFLFASWVPTPLGAALRAVLYPLVVRMGWPVLIEKNVTIHRPGARGPRRAGAARAGRGGGARRGAGGARRRGAGGAARGGRGGRPRGRGGGRGGRGGGPREGGGGGAGGAWRGRGGGRDRSDEV